MIDAEIDLALRIDELGMANFSEPPNVIVPMVMVETLSPERPSKRYSISASQMNVVDLARRLSLRPDNAKC
jgi:hypothetical protein